jgi:hypothetical protein
VRARQREISQPAFELPPLSCEALPDAAGGEVDAVH